MRVCIGSFMNHPLLSNAPRSRSAMRLCERSGRLPRIGAVTDLA